jgi:hypothetical protein
MTIRLPVTFIVGDGLPFSASISGLNLDRGALQGAPRRTARPPRIPRDPARAAWEVAWRARRPDYASAAELLGRSTQADARGVHWWHLYDARTWMVWRNMYQAKREVAEARRLRLSPDWVSLP